MTIGAHDAGCLRVASSNTQPSPPSLLLGGLHGCPESFKCHVPLSSDLLEILAYLREALCPYLPDPLAPFASAAHETRLRERVQMLGDRLARYVRSLRQADDGLGAAAAQPRDDIEARLVAQCGEHRCCMGE